MAHYSPQACWCVHCNEARSSAFWAGVPTINWSDVYDWVASWQ